MSKFNTHTHLADGSLIRTAETGEWDLTLPDGRHLTGRAETEAAAKAAATEAHKAWVYAQWCDKGEPVAGQAFKVPLIR